jgi:hypothetical protein
MSSKRIGTIVDTAFEIGSFKTLIAAVQACRMVGTSKSKDH